MTKPAAYCEPLDVECPACGAPISAGDVEPIKESFRVGDSCVRCLCDARAAQRKREQIEHISGVRQ